MTIFKKLITNKDATYGDAEFPKDGEDFHYEKPEAEERIEWKYIAKAVRNLQKNDPDWQPYEFCDCCPMLILHAASRTDPGDLDCVAGLDPLDYHCYRKNMLEDDPKVIHEAEEYMFEDEELALDNVVVLTELESAERRMQDNLDVAITSIVSAYNGIVTALRVERNGGDAA